MSASKVAQAAAVLCVLSGCAAPSSPEVASAAVPAGPPAKRCTVNGMSWQGSQTSVSPTMTVSNDGWCQRSVSLSGSSGVMMEVASPPSHGRVTTRGSNSMRAFFRYYPEPGYEGPDSFVLQTGLGGQIAANVAVTVTK